QEADLLKAIELGHNAIRTQVKIQMELRDKIGGKAKREYTKPYTNPELEERIRVFGAEKMYQVAKAALGKHERREALRVIRTEWEATLTEGELTPEDAGLISMYFHDVEKEVIRNMMLNDRIRLDGRTLDKVRQLTIESDFLP